MNGPEGVVPKFFGPDYWDGHMLGDDRVSSEDLSIHEDSLLPERHIRKLAKQLLKEGLGAAANNEPLRTFNSGQLFDAMAVHEGTFVLFDNERLFHAPTFDIGEDIGESPDTTQLDWRTEYFISRSQDDVKYVRNIRWGVVVADKQQDYLKRLVAGSASNLQVYPNGKSSYIPIGLFVYKPRLPLGQVRHYRAPSGSEVIERVNRVELYRSERPIKERKPAKEKLLGRRVIGWG